MEARRKHYEADPRHAELSLQALNIKPDSKGTSVPGTKDEVDIHGESPKLAPYMATQYRAIVARAIYLSQDRPDIGFSAKELSRSMATPTELAMTKLKRLGRYLQDHKRYVKKYRYQCNPKQLTIYSDTDWAGCRTTRKSTSGGIAMFGTHILKSYSSTQGVIALSSGEAEYYGLTKASSVILGIKGMCSDLGLTMPGEVMTDASAAKGIANRIGLGKLRHLETSQLWLQSKVADCTIKITKVKGTENPADALTNFLSGPSLSELCGMVDIKRTNNKHHTAVATV
jgi:hypothetical protein